MSEKLELAICRWNAELLDLEAQMDEGGGGAKKKASRKRRAATIRQIINGLEGLAKS